MFCVKDFHCELLIFLRPGQWSVDTDRMALTSRLILLAVTLSLSAAEKLAIVSVSPDLVVREGESVNMSCGADQDWFFCLWKHPSGVKECTIQENGGYRSVCAGLNHINIFGGDRSCSLSVENVSLGDHGTFMCLLNQADVFHTDRKYVNLAVATPASLGVRRLGEEEEEQEETGVLEMVEGEVVELQCLATGAFPRVEFLWNLPGVERVETKEVNKRPRLTVRFSSELTHFSPSSRRSLTLTG